MKTAYFKHILSLLFFGVNGIIASRISLSSHQIVLFRTMLGSLLMGLVIIFARKANTLFKFSKEALFVIGSGVSMGISWMCLYEAFDKIGVSIATLIYYSGPIIVMMLSPLVFKEKLAPVKLIGFFAVVIGVLLINAQNLEGERNTAGMIYSCFSAFTYALMVILNKKSQKIKGLENTFLQLLSAFATVLLLLFLKGEFIFKIKGEDWKYILLLGVLNTGFGCYLYFSTIGKLSVQTVAVLGYIEPLTALFCSFVFLKERMLLSEVVGAVLIIGGAFFCEVFAEMITKKE